MDSATIIFAEGEENTTTSILHFINKLEKDTRFSVIHASNCNKILENLKSNRPDFILYDLDTSSNQENDLFNHISTQNDLKDVHLIFVSQQKNIHDKIKQFDQLTQRITQLEEVCTVDPLTNLYNRRYLEERIEKEISRSHRRGFPISCLMIDVDNFKSINDTYGHQTGDIVLMKIALILMDSCRTADVICRYGGEEFTVVLPETDTTGALMTAERIREKVENEVFSINGVDFSISVSIGVSSKTANQPINKQILIELADKSLYKAKRSGKNRVMIYED